MSFTRVCVVTSAVLSLILISGALLLFVNQRRSDDLGEIRTGVARNGVPNGPRDQTEDFTHKKNVICISGQARRFLELANNVFEFIVAPNDADVFLHLYLEESELAQVPSIRALPWVTKFRYEPYSTDVIKEINMLHLQQVPLANLSSHFLKQGNTFSMWRKQALCAQLINDHEIEHGFQYEMIMRTRPDLLYHDAIILSDCPNGRLCVPASISQRSEATHVDNQTSSWFTVLPDVQKCVSDADCHNPANDEVCRLNECEWMCRNAACSPFRRGVNDQLAWGPRSLMQVYSAVYYWQSARPTFFAERGLYFTLQEMRIFEYVWRPSKIYRYDLHGRLPQNDSKHAKDS
eukprot:TRINITY_DN15325_c0_g1_i1.p1 TRINITY_DN15325_c0_g1~~TRINITY_DN15325_c0_g1_i1.p1  ORF type:complete len:348 (+),score=44.86 TRINITY_DN15325_c0_g1_i1:90-1133(+)